VLGLWSVRQVGVKTGPWTAEEDAILHRCMEQGMSKWSDIAKQIPGRLSKRVRPVTLGT
jgi:hypothetical protein